MELTAASFSGHESFPFRNTWLTKGVRAVASGDPTSSTDQDDAMAEQGGPEPTFFTDQDKAMVKLGVGKNMVRSIRHWCLATKMLEEDPDQPNNRGRYLRPTDLGAKLFLGADAWDPYLEDTGSLWLIHWLLTTNSTKATTWYYAFSEIHEPEFSRKQLLNRIAELAERIPNLRFSPNTLKRDVDTFIRTYVGARVAPGQDSEDTLDCPLTELGLIAEQSERDLYSFVRGPKDSLPDAVFVYALSEYAQNAPSRDTFSFEELAYWAGSPGRVFKLDEPALSERLERLVTVTDGAWQFSETAGLKQVLLRGDVNPQQILADYYRPQARAAQGAER